MKRLFPYLVVFVLGMLLTNAYYANRLSTHNVSALSEVEGKYNSLHQRLSFVEENYTHKRIIRFWGYASTEDRELSRKLSFFNVQGSVTNRVFKVTSGYKGGPAIIPEVRLPSGSTNAHEFDIKLNETKGKIVDAWIAFSHWDADFSGLDQFYIHSIPQKDVLRLAMRPKSGHSFQTRFEIVVLME